jgi:hypothetical protein
MSWKTLICLLTLSLLLPGTGAHAAPKSSGVSIKKCQDATGKWHYGNTAAEECSRSKVTVITEKGTTKSVIAAPPTEAELKEREAQRETVEAEQARATERARKDKLLLSTYGVEDDIIYIRDRKIAQVEASVKASEETLKPLRAALARMQAQATEESNDPKAAEATAKNIETTRNQIARHEGAIATKRQEQEALRQQYTEELERYRELKKKAPAAPVSKQEP